MSNESSVYQVTAGETDKRVTGEIALVDANGNSLFTETGVVLSGDTRIYTGAGAPVDYTDGTPPATGEGEAGIGSLYIDTTNGDIYINGGTKAQPTWQAITHA